MDYLPTEEQIQDAIDEEYLKQLEQEEKENERLKQEVKWATSGN